MLAVNKSSEPIAKEAALLRREIINALYQCGGGHYGGSLSVPDIILVLYRNRAWYGINLFLEQR